MPTRPPSPDTTGCSGKPTFLLLIIIVTIFVFEVLIMVGLPVLLPSLSVYQEALLDAFLLSTIVFPVLYFLVFKPLTTHIAQQQRAEMVKDALISDLNGALAEVKTLQGIIPICSSCNHLQFM